MSNTDIKNLPHIGLINLTYTTEVYTYNPDGSVNPYPIFGGNNKESYMIAIQGKDMQECATKLTEKLVELDKTLRGDINATNQQRTDFGINLSKAREYPAGNETGLDTDQESDSGDSARSGTMDNDTAEE